MEILSWVRSQWDRAAALLAMIVGLLALLLGWIGVSGSEFVAKQLPYIVSGGFFGILMIGVAGALWLSADLRDEWRELRGLRVQLRALQGDAEVPATRRQAGGALSDQLTSQLPAVTDYSGSHPEIDLR
jgi:hypothetical protein